MATTAVPSSIEKEFSNDDGTPHDSSSSESVSANAPGEPGAVRPQISVVIPLYNEEGSLTELHDRLTKVLENVGEPYEILFIDDGSRDRSPEVLKGLCESDPRCSQYRFRRNLGKAAALSVAFERARGEIIITMDADLQDEPAEIPRFLEELDSGFDMVSGWKKKRHDPVGKTLPSRLFNWATRKMTGLELHDFNCGFKAYRAECVRGMALYGELHRYIPAIVHWKGFRVGEIAVEHHPRIHGVSKYGWERFVRGMFDLITVVFLTRYTRKPLHLFGGIGLILFVIGIVIDLYLSVLHFMGQHIYDRPLLSLGVLMMILGAQFVSTGLIAELIISQRNPGDYDEFVLS